MAQAEWDVNACIQEEPRKLRHVYRLRKKVAYLLPYFLWCLKKRLRRLFYHTSDAKVQRAFLSARVSERERRVCHGIGFCAKWPPEVT